MYACPDPSVIAQAMLTFGPRGVGDLHAHLLPLELYSLV